MIAGQARAEEEFAIVPAVSLKEEYNDNIHFSQRSKDSSFITAVSPSVSLLQKSERLSTNLSARLDLLYYSSASDLNSTDQNYWGTASYQFTPLFKAGASASYIRDSPVDRILESSGLVINSPREQQDYSLTGKYIMTEKLAGNLTYAYQQINYNSSLLTDIFAHFAYAGVEYDLNKILPLVKVRGDVGFNHADYSTAAVDVSTVDTYSATIGASRSLHELWSISADVGGRVSEYSFLVPRKLDEERWGWIAKMALEYHDDFTTGYLNFFHNLQNITGYAVPTEQTSVTVLLTRKFSSEFSGSLFAGFFLNSAENSGQANQDTNKTTYLISPGLTYALTRNLFFNLAYEYAIVHDRLNDTNSDRNRIFARLTYQYPIPLF
ncbi:hypothetical protein OR1_03003 [Geobacter sp. OR-1]|nr:hypothetical protein OR1_03003 [Geobacter sp. OR-1]